MDDAALAGLDKSVKSAHRAAVLALIAVVLAVLVLAIDHSIKQSIIDEAQRVRLLLDELKQVVRDGTAAGTVGAASGGGGVAGGVVVHDSAAPEATVPDANGSDTAGRGRAAGKRGGPRGDA